MNILVIIIILLIIIVVFYNKKKNAKKIENDILKVANIEQWLAKQNNCNIKNIQEVYSSEIGIDFLLVWSLYENKCFGFELTPNKFDHFSNKNQNIAGNLEAEILHFYNRYKNKGDKFKNLNLAASHKKKIIQIIDNFDNETPANKVAFLIYIIHRFRNNMFHGTKLINTWFSEYKTEINYCITAMQKLVENQTSKK